MLDMLYTVIYFFLQVKCRSFSQHIDPAALCHYNPHNQALYRLNLPHLSICYSWFLLEMNRIFRRVLRGGCWLDNGYM